MDKTQLLVIDGGTVKTNAEGIVEGLGIVFGSESEPDQSPQHDFFTEDSFIQKKSTFSVPLFYNHGMPFDDQIGEATLTKSANGWMTTAEIDTTTELGKKVYEAVQEKPHGFSTGALQHLVKREAKSNGTNFLKKWVVGEISLTERPAERKAIVQSIKSVGDEIIYEEAFPSEKPATFNIELVGDEDKILWSSIDEATKSLTEITDPVKKINIKSDVYGTVTYNISQFDNDSDAGYSMTVYEYGGAASFISHLQELLNVAAAAVAKDAQKDDLESNDMTVANLVGDEKSFNSRVAKIVKSMMSKTDEKVDELTKQLEDRDNQLAELKTQLETRENDLANANERNAQLEILAGAKETINKYKGI
jgi:hypothetical protein